MIGQLPVGLRAGGIEYPIETDYRNILPVLVACADPDYTPEEKTYT